MKLLAPTRYSGITVSDVPENCYHPLIGSRVIVSDWDGTKVKGTIAAYFNDLEVGPLFGIEIDPDLLGNNGVPYDANDYFEPELLWHQADEFDLLNVSGIGSPLLHLFHHLEFEAKIIEG